MKKVGAVTIGQSPRVDLVPEVAELLGTDIEILEVGALDGLSAGEMASLAPAGDGDAEISLLRGGDVLVSRLRDGSWVSLSEEKILPLLGRCVEKLEDAEVEMILMLCTGKFPDSFSSRVPLIFPQKLLYAVVPQLADRVGVVTPAPSQLAQSREKWSAVAGRVTVACANPYENAAGLEEAADRFLSEGVRLCVMDCMGYNREMKGRLEALTGLPVILPRTLTARVAAEMLE